MNIAQLEAFVKTVRASGGGTTKSPRLGTSRTESSEPDLPSHKLVLTEAGRSAFEHAEPIADALDALRDYLRTPPRS